MLHDPGVYPSHYPYRISFWNGVVMNEIGRFDGFGFVGYSQKLAFAVVKFHFPFYSPKLLSIEVVLESGWVARGFNSSVKEGVVWEQPIFGSFMLCLFPDTELLNWSEGATPVGNLLLTTITTLITLTLHSEAKSSPPSSTAIDTYLWSCAITSHQLRNPLHYHHH